MASQDLSTEATIVLTCPDLNGITRKSRGLTLNDLPLEIRRMIYRRLYCGPDRIVELKAELPWQMVVSQSDTQGLSPESEVGEHTVDVLSAFVSSVGNLTINTTLDKGSLSLLRTSRQVHQEAARVLYGENSFHFCHISDPVGHNRRWAAREENLTRVPSEYLKMITKCTLDICINAYGPAWPLDPATQTAAYLDSKRRLADFAALFCGIEHSLREVTVRFNQIDISGQNYRLCLQKCQNVLEPLGAIYGVTTSVVVRGVTPDLGAKLSMAMISSTLACTPKEEEYGLRRRKFRRQKRQFNLRPYYESRFHWDAGLQELIKQQNEQKSKLYSYPCCEVCGPGRLARLKKRKQ